MYEKIIRESAGGIDPIDFVSCKIESAADIPIEIVQEHYEKIHFGA